MAYFRSLETLRGAVGKSKTRLSFKSRFLKVIKCLITSNNVDLESAKSLGLLINFIFLFVGGNNKIKFFERLKRRIKKNGVEENIIFVGNISDMPAIYSIADVVLSTSIEPEAFGRISAEGCSMRKPVISSNHGGSKDIIENEKTGWLVEPRNPTKLAEKIIQVINMPEKKKDQIVKSARVRVQKKFSLDQMLNKTINLYEELVARRENINY